MIQEAARLLCDCDRPTLPWLSIWHRLTNAQLHRCDEWSTKTQGEKPECEIKRDCLHVHSVCVCDPTGGNVCALHEFVFNMICVFMRSHVHVCAPLLRSAVSLNAAHAVRRAERHRDDPSLRPVTPPVAAKTSLTETQLPIYCSRLSKGPLSVSEPPPSRSNLPPSRRLRRNPSWWIGGES